MAFTDYAFQGWWRRHVYNWCCQQSVLFSFSCLACSLACLLTSFHATRRFSLKKPPKNKNKTNTPPPPPPQKKRKEKEKGGGRGGGGGGGEASKGESSACAVGHEKREIPARMITMMALRGAVPDLLQSPHCAANCLQHVRSNGPGTVVCKSRAARGSLVSCTMPCATWYGVNFARVEIAFLF